MYSMHLTGCHSKIKLVVDIVLMLLCRSNNALSLRCRDEGSGLEHRKAIKQILRSRKEFQYRQ